MTKLTSPLHWLYATFALGLVLAGLAFTPVQPVQTAHTVAPEAAEPACASVTQIPQSECEALVSLYYSTSGAGWRYRTGWLATNTPCSWYGVTCSAGHVTTLNLTGNRLRGSLPPEIGNLSYLEGLNLSSGWESTYQNRFIGGLPPELGNLSSLKSLDLNHSQLSGGSIPPAIGSLNNLEWLDLSHTQLGGSLPPELGNLTGLLTLDLQFNQIYGGIPPELGNLTNLQVLILSWNRLSGSIPPELGSLGNLQYLDIEENSLSGSLPAELGNLSNLQEAYLGANDLSGPIPSELGNLTSLTGLYLYYNQLSGAIPPELSNLANLQHLNLSSNHLSGNIPPELGNLSSLEYLHLDYNYLTGSIPPELGNLPSLEYLGLGGNQLTGSIPVELTTIAGLGEIHLSFNQLTGSIPAEFGNMPNMAWLDLANNRLSGSIPPELGNLPLLQALLLDNNQLSGELPPELGNLPELWKLYLSNNQLTGSLPPEFGSLAKLEELSLSNNQLTGSIPAELGNSSPLLFIYLDHNRLTGAVPAQLGNLRNLHAMSLNANPLNGPLPLSLRNVPMYWSFFFEDTNLCEPDNTSFQAWLDGIPEVRRTHICGPGQISGTVTDEGGIPISGVSIRGSSNASTLTDQNGSYQLTGLLDGTHTISPMLGWSGFTRVFSPTSTTLILPPDHSNVDFIATADALPTCATVTQVPQSECEALVAIYNSSNGDQWNYRAGWLRNDTPCSWSGVKCSGGHVTGLDLSYSGLQGSIPVEIADLTYLQELNLAGIHLSGGIPLELFSLAELRELSLSSMELSGSIPAGLGSLTELEVLDLSYNELTGSIPPELANLSNLKQLNLANNQLSGSLPAELGNLTGLKSLYLEENPLSGRLPISLANLPLTTFYYNNTNLCEPADPAFQAWLAGIGNLVGTRMCGSSVSGLVRVKGGGILSGVTLETSAGFSTTTNAYGLYQFNGQITGTHTITPQLSGYSFTPPTASVTVPPDRANVNFTATPVHPACASVTEIPQAECDALAALYDSTNGDGWFSRYGWLVNNAPCDWYGISCWEGHVTYLALDSNNLIGTVPENLDNLSNLRVLYLNHNQLSGNIPATLGNLTHLQELTLHVNQLSGNIPEALGDLTNLQWLSLSLNQLNGNIPEELGNLTNLQWLYLSHNQLSGSVPATLGDLANLSDLYLSSNPLSGPLPLSLTNLSLTVFAFDNTGLCEPADPAFQAWLSGIPILWRTYICGPFQVSGAVTDASGNPVPGVTLWVSPTLSVITDDGGAYLLTGLITGTHTLTPHLGWNTFSPVTATITVPPNQANVNFIATYGDSFTCAAITQIPQIECEALVALYNSTNGDEWLNNTGWLVTDTPCSWYGISCWFGNVLYLHLDDNQLNGSIPPELGNLSELGMLGLSNNQLSGSIPPRLGELTHLTGIYLDNNLISGSIPSELGNLIYLMWLDLHNNQLSGSIPSEVINLASLSSLNLSGNQFTGSIPSTNLSNLLFLDLDSNQLSGSIPPTFGNLTYLEILRLANNQLTGSIPAQLGSLTKLQELSLNNNQLTGSIPSTLGNLTNLNLLYLSNNQISGSIPPQFGYLTKLVAIDLSQNQLSGAIPHHLGSLKWLASLNLSNNQLIGDIPIQLTNLIYLGTYPDPFIVDFGYNRLTASDANLIVFLNNVDPDWSATQTIAPTGLSATLQDVGVLLSWTPITYTQDGGYYEVSYALNISGPYTVYGNTPDKVTASYPLTGLAGGNPYYLRVRTFTPAHNSQQNDLWSSYTSTTVFTGIHADFVANQISGPAPLAVQFTNLSSGDFTTCAWSFGDGKESANCSDPTHIYTEPGIYTVTLTITGAGGTDAEVKTDYITVTEQTGYTLYLPLTMR